MTTFTKLIAIVVIIIASFPLFAQENTVPLCGKIDIVTPELEEKLNLFTEYEDFQQALLYKESDDQYTLEIIYKKNNSLKVDKKPMTQAALDQFCQQINTSKDVETILNTDQNGRTEFLISSTASGLGFYGWAIPRALETDDFRVNLATYMLVSGSSFFVPFLATKNKTVSRPMARAYSIGTVTGIGHGFLLKGLIDINKPLDFNEPNQYRSTLALPIVLGLGESIGMMALTNKYDLSLSNVAMIGSGGIWGGAWGAALGTIAYNQNTDANTNTKKALVSTLVGSGAGMYLGHFVHKKTPDMTNGDVIVTNAYGGLGLLYAATIADFAINLENLTFNHLKITTGSLTAASIGGLAYGLRRTSNYNYTTSEGAYIGLSEVAGGLLGLGTGYLLSENLSSEAALVSTTVGATAGLLLVDNYLRKRSLKVDTSIGNFDFGFNPMGVANAFEEDNSIKDLEYYQRSTNNYIVRIGMQF